MPFLHAESMPASSAQAILSEPTHARRFEPSRYFALVEQALRRVRDSSTEEAARCTASVRDRGMHTEATHEELVTEYSVGLRPGPAPVSA